MNEINTSDLPDNLHDQAMHSLDCFMCFFDFLLAGGINPNIALAAMVKACCIIAAKEIKGLPDEEECKRAIVNNFCVNLEQSLTDLKEADAQN